MLRELRQKHCDIGHIPDTSCVKIQKNKNLCHWYKSSFYYATTYKRYFPLSGSLVFQIGKSGTSRKPLVSIRQSIRFGADVANFIPALFCCSRLQKNIRAWTYIRIANQVLQRNLGDSRLGDGHQNADIFLPLFKTKKWVSAVVKLKHPVLIQI